MVIHYLPYLPTSCFRSPHSYFKVLPPRISKQGCQFPGTPVFGLIWADLANRIKIRGLGLRVHEQLLRDKHQQKVPRVSADGYRKICSRQQVPRLEPVSSRVGIFQRLNPVVATLLLRPVNSPNLRGTTLDIRTRKVSGAGAVWPGPGMEGLCSRHRRIFAFREQRKL